MAHTNTTTTDADDADDTTDQWADARNANGRLHAKKFRAMIREQNGEDAGEDDRPSPPEHGPNAPIRAAPLHDKRRLAALYYGGCPESPSGLTQQALADYLGVGAATISRAMSGYGIHPPTAYHTRRASDHAHGDNEDGDRSANTPPDPARVAARYMRGDGDGEGASTADES